MKAHVLQPFTTGTATWNMQTLTSLGITPGTYTWTLNSIFDGDTIVLNAVGPAGVPEPGSLALLAGGIAALGGHRRIRRRRQSTADYDPSTSV